MGHEKSQYFVSTSSGAGGRPGQSGRQHLPPSGARCAYIGGLTILMKVFVIGLLVGVFVLPVFGYFYFRFGFAPVATAASPLPFEKTLAHMALKARIRKEAPKDSSVPVS